MDAPCDPSRVLVAAASALALVGCLDGEETDGSIDADVAEQNESRPDMLAPLAEKRRLAKSRSATDDVVAWQKDSVHLGNAYWLARLSEIAYLGEDDALRAIEKLGVKPVDVFLMESPCSGAAALYVRMRGYGVIAFRGTEPDSLNDIATDLASLKIDWSGPGLVHEGFFNQYQSLFAPTCLEANVMLDPFLGENHGSGGYASVGPLYVTGHSLGGALATMLVATAQSQTCGDDRDCIDRPGLDLAALYTFGSPKVGNEHFAHALAERAVGHVPIYRFVHRQDVVTGVPRNLNAAESLTSGDYLHPAYEGGSESTLQVWLGRDRLVVGEHVNHLLVSIPDHDIGQDGYVGAIERYALKRGELR